MDVFKGMSQMNTCIGLPAALCRSAETQMPQAKPEIVLARFQRQISVVSRQLIHSRFEESTYPQSQAGKINYWTPMTLRSKAANMSWTSSLRRSMRTCMRNIIWNAQKLQLLMERETWDQTPSIDGFAFWEISLCNLEEAAALRSCATWEVVKWTLETS